MTPLPRAIACDAVMVIMSWRSAVFVPEGSSKTLAEEKPDADNARYLAVRSLVAGQVLQEHAPIREWKGKWQEHA